LVGCSCQLDRKHPAKYIDIKPKISSTLNSIGQVDLIKTIKINFHFYDHFRIEKVKQSQVSYGHYSLFKGLL
jgi:hypothetical protein